MRRGKNRLFYLVSLVLFCVFPGPVSAQIDCIDGMAGEFSCRNIDLLSHMPLNEFGGFDPGSDNWGWKDPQSGRYYALMGRASMTSFVDVTDPVNPVYLGNMASTLGDPIGRDIKTYANHAFVVADVNDHGMQVFDLTRLRGVSSPQTFSPDALYTEIGNTHNIAINEETGFAYLVGGSDLGWCGGGMHIVDIRTPKSPTQAGCFDATGFIHDTQCVIYRGPDSDHNGAEICFASHVPNLSIFDVSDKNNIRLLGQVTWPQQRFAHQGWLTQDQRYFLMGDEGDESRYDLNTKTIVLDVNDLDGPDFVGSYLADTTAIDHNQYVKGNLLYQANYSAGLRILRIGNLASSELTEVAWFDTYPDNDSTGGANGDLGAWNVYPFLDNGTLLVSDSTTGLFVLRANFGNEFRINPGLNGSWFDPATTGQGFFLEVFPDIPLVFLAWFTYDTTQPAGIQSNRTENPLEKLFAAQVGDDNHRWLTAQGPFDGNTANLNVTLTTGGLFDDPAPVTNTPEGTITLTFEDCTKGTVDYDFTAAGISGSVPISRPANDNVALCESLGIDGQASTGHPYTIH